MGSKIWDELAPESEPEKNSKMVSESQFSLMNGTNSNKQLMASEKIQNTNKNISEKIQNLKHQLSEEFGSKVLKHPNSVENLEKDFITSFQNKEILKKNNSEFHNQVRFFK